MCKTYEIYHQHMLRSPTDPAASRSHSVQLLFWFTLCFYRAIKLGQLYGTNSVRPDRSSTCYWLGGWARLVLLEVRAAPPPPPPEDPRFYLWHWGPLAENLEVDYSVFTAIIEFWKMFKATRLQIKDLVLLLSKEWKFFQTTSGELRPSLISLTYSAGFGGRAGWTNM